MPDYYIGITRYTTNAEIYDPETEIWTEITDRETCKTITKRIWWEDDEGVYHDETPSLPIELREDVDNAWIEKSRKW